MISNPAYPDRLAIDEIAQLLDRDLGVTRFAAAAALTQDAAALTPHRVRS